MAEVYLAKVAGPGGFEKMVVLKKILPQLSDNDVYVNMFLAEARLAAQLDHPNIVHVFDFGEIEGTYFLSMEYVEGANLRQVLRWAIRSDQPIQPAIAAKIVSLACEGLSYAHEYVPPGGGEVTRLVHRDVSPENIMLSRFGAVKLLDFGVAKVTSEDNRSKVGSLKGKIAYMPPEQIKGTGVDHRTDIYALGVVLYQTLSGKRPYGQATDVALITAILQEEPTPLLKHRLDLPDNLLEIVAKAMNKDPSKRYQSCTELRDALEVYIAHEGQPVTPSQIAALVAAYQAANPEPLSRSGLASQPQGSSGVEGDSSEHGSRSPTGEESSRGEPPPSSAPGPGVVGQAMSGAAQAAPGVQPTPALAPELGPEPDTSPELFPGMPSTPQPGLEAPPLPGGRTVTPARVPAVTVARPAGPESVPAQVRKWTPHPVAPEPIRHALREGLRADRSGYLLRKLPPVIGRLVDLAQTIPLSVSEALAGTIDAALLAEDHQAIGRILDRAESRPGRDRRFWNLVTQELTHPLRIAWVVERLRSGVPGDTAGLRAWLNRLGPPAGTLLVEALEASEPGPVQELFAEALAFALPADPSLVIRRLEGTPLKLKNVAALAFALERSQVTERARVFQSLYGRRDPQLQVEVMVGRAKARASDALVLLEGGLGDKAEEVRKRAIELTGELGGAKGFALLQRIMRDQSFEARPPGERSRCWAALLDCGGDAALAEIDAVLLSKATLLNKKKVVEAKLTVIDGLSRAKTEAARVLLERTAADKAQGDEVHTAARNALNGSRAISKEVPVSEQKAVGERRTQIIARVCLDLVLLARASTTVDVGSGLLDAAIQQFRDGLRQLLAQDGRVQFVAEPAPEVNGLPVTFPIFHEAVAPAVLAALQPRDLKGFLVEAMLPMAEYRSFLLRAFDPDGRNERLPHIKAVTFSGAPLLPVADAPTPADPTARAKEIFAALVRWLHAQREGLSRGRSLELTQIDSALDDWARLVFDSTAHFMGVQRWAPGDTGTLVHAVNTAALSMAFARDLGLPRSALRELCELSLMLGLAEAVGPPENRLPATEATADNERFHAAGLLLTHRLNRLGTAAAIAAVEAGLPAEASGRGPGLLASIHALAKTYDALTAGNGTSAGQAIEQINGRLKPRFSPDLLGLFTQWAFSQSSH
jgi:serine/threonine-protein kinase